MKMLKRVSAGFKRRFQAFEGLFRKNTKQSTDFSYGKPSFPEQSKCDAIPVGSKVLPNQVRVVERGPLETLPVELRAMVIQNLISEDPATTSRDVSSLKRTNKWIESHVASSPAGKLTKDLNEIASIAEELHRAAIPAEKGNMSGTDSEERIACIEAVLPTFRYQPRNGTLSSVIETTRVRDRGLLLHRLAKNLDDLPNYQKALVIDQTIKLLSDEDMPAAVRATDPLFLVEKELNDTQIDKVNDLLENSYELHHYYEQAQRHHRFSQSRRSLRPPEPYSDKRTLAQIREDIAVLEKAPFPAKLRQMKAISLSLDAHARQLSLKYANERNNPDERERSSYGI